MYLDKLHGRIDNAYYDRISAQWRTEQMRLLREIERHGQAEESYMDAASNSWNWLAMLVSYSFDSRTRKSGS